MELSELSSYQEASLFRSGLEEWQEGPQVLTYGAILICRKGFVWSWQRQQSRALFSCAGISEAVRA